MSRLVLPALWFSLACGAPRSVERVVGGLGLESAGAASPAPTVQSADSVHWGRRTGAWTGASPMARPAVQWSLTLPGPLTYPVTTDGEAIFAVSGGNVYSLEVTGLKRWTARVQAAGPVVVDTAGLLVPTQSGRIALLETETGKVITETEPISSTHAAPSVLGGVIVWVTSDGLFATSAGDVHQLSTTPLTDLASDGQRIYVGSRGGRLMAVDVGGVVWEAELPGPAIGHPVVGDDAVYIATAPQGEADASLVAVGRSDGVMRWTSPISSTVAASPALGSLLIVPGLSGDLFAMDLRHGGIRWRAPGLAGFSVQPAIANETIYAGNADGRLYRVDIHDGGEAWSVELGAPITGEPAMVKGRIVIGLSDGRLMCLQ